MSCTSRPAPKNSFRGTIERRNTGGAAAAAAAAALAIAAGGAMPAVDTLGLPEARSHLAKRIEDARTIRNKADAEKRALSGEELQTINRLLAEADPLQKRITALAEAEETRGKLATMEAFLNATPGRRSDPEQPGRLGGGQNGQEDRSASSTEEARDNEARSIAFGQWLRFGESRMTPVHRQLLGPQRQIGEEEHRATRHDREYRRMCELKGIDPDAPEFRADLAVGAGATGGYVVAPLFQSEISRAAKLYSGVRQAGAQHFTTDTGADLPFPTQDDTGNVATIVTEAGDLGDSAAALSQKTISTYLYSTGVIKASLQFLQDSAVNVQSWLAECLAERMGRGVNVDWTTGSGSGAPQGIVTAMTGASIGVTAASATAITADEILNLQHSVDPAYREDPTACYGLSDGVLNKVRLLKDSYGRYLLDSGNGGMTAGAPSTIWGRPYKVFTSMSATLVTATNVMLYGPMRFYKTREVGGMTLFRFNELYMKNGQIGFVMFGRWGGAYVDPGNHPIKSLKTA